MSKGARIKNSSHERLPWRLREIAPDFELIDAWRLPATGTYEDFADLPRVFAGLGVARGRGWSPTSILFKVRWWLGQRLGWDERTSDLPIPRSTETSLRERLPADLPPATLDPDGDSPFDPVYQTEVEWAGEISNSTVHAVLHLGWVQRKDGLWRGQMGVYVKHRGWLGKLYMPLIAPFRHYIVYPALMRSVGGAWKARHDSVSLAPERSAT
ncbi:MAG TPA: DUF2867 domain-containing protein [Dehalococcoidia bacterium]|nr:DUF2867 domain-containing protein [Dehalococcoidia bacterium]